MEPGKLSVTKSNRGKIIIEVFFQGRRGQTKLTIHGSSITDPGLNGKEVEFERKDGQISQIICDGKLIYSKDDPAHTSKKIIPQKAFQQKNKMNITATEVSKIQEKPRSDNLQMDHAVKIQEKNKAKAPYNFIPLNEKVADAEPIPDFDRYHPDRFTGYIDLEIETKTPLYIRDSLNNEEMNAKESAEKNGKRDIHSDFFSPGGKLKIPGSSLRGMIRTLVEIISYGRFGEFDDKGLYFRGLADKSNLRFEYQSKMSSFDKQQKKTIHKMSAGFLFKKGFDYFIRPASGFKQIPKNEARKKIEKSGQPYNPFNFYKVEDGWIVVSGPMPRKKKEWFIFDKISIDEFPIGSVDVLNYKNDSNRSGEVPNLIEKAGKINEVPCFYVRWKDNLGKERVSFGHTGMFRLAYEKSIGDHIPEPLRGMSYEITPDRLKRIEDKKIPDNIIQGLKKLDKKIFTENEFKEKNMLIIGKQKEFQSTILKHTGKYDIPVAIFGNAETFSSRVFFEDAFLKNDHNPNEVLMKENIPKLLQSPKPTTFQHYLVQPKDDLKNRRHYNDNSAIRGNKLYWHKSGENWIENDPQKRKNENLITKIKPVKAKTKFSGQIRFENLTSVELGALLFALDLPEGCFHKMGMGKPIGLGSVKITPELYLSDRKKRYEDLFFEWENENKKINNFANFKQNFEQYVLNQVGEKTGSLWETERLAQLKIMLNFASGLKNESESKTRYMEIEKGEYKNRPILPLPKHV